MDDLTRIRRQVELGKEVVDLREQMTPNASALFELGSEQPAQQMLVERACLVEDIEEQLRWARDLAKLEIGRNYVRIRHCNFMPELIDLTEVEVEMASRRLILEVQLAVLGKDHFRQLFERQRA